MIRNGLDEATELSQASSTLESELDQADHQAAEAEKNAIQVLTNTRAKGDSNQMLGEGLSPRASMLAISRAKDKLDQITRQQKAVISQAKHHDAMEKKLMVEDVRIEVGLK